MEEVQIFVRYNITSIEEEIRKKHKITGEKLDCHIEDDSLVFIFSASKDRMSHDIEKPRKKIKGQAPDHTDVMTPTGIVAVPIKRRRKAKRKRMKTRGWRTIASFTNSLGQKARVYEPFVEALKDRRLSKREQRAIVEKILASNKNMPADSSIEYFLNNTLEYLKSIEHKQKAN